MPKTGGQLIAESLYRNQVKNIFCVPGESYLGALDALFDKKKSISASRVKVKRKTTKEIKFRPSTDIGDYNIKLKKIKSFILDGDKTKISVRFRGREILNSDMGLELLNKIKDELGDVSQVDQEPSLEGRQLQMVMSPIKKK